MTEHEHSKDKFKEEYEYLRDLWGQIFGIEPQDEDLSMEARLEVKHPPPGFRILLHEVIEESGAAFAEQLQGEATVEEKFNALVELSEQALKVFAVRFFRLGQASYVDLPWKEMERCSCVTVTDEELKELLSEN